MALSCRLEVAQELLLLTHISAESVSDEALAEEGAPAAAGPSSKSMDRTLRNRRLLLEAAMQMDVSEPPPAPSTGGGLLGGIGQAIAGATQAILGGGPTSPPNTIQLPCPAPTVGAQFDTLQDRSCVDEGVLVEMGKFFSKISKISYSKPEALVGLPALKELDRWLSHGLELHGGRDDKGFLFLYELIRGDLVFKLLANDTGHALGAVLMRLLPTSDTCKPGFLMSVLRVLLHNPQVKSAPPFPPSPFPLPPPPPGRCWREAARTRRDETQVIQMSPDSDETQRRTPILPDWPWRMNFLPLFLGSSLDFSLNFSLDFFLPHPINPSIPASPASSASLPPLAGGSPPAALRGQSQHQDLVDDPGAGGHLEAGRAHQGGPP